MSEFNKQTVTWMKEIKKGVAQIVGEDELMAKLEKAEVNQKPLTIKLGLDPTAPDIHLGHTVVLRKLRQFQNMGHKVLLIIGDFTGCIGDPTGRDKSRPKLTREEVLKNADTYEKQFCKVLDKDKTIVCFNSEWLGEMTAFELVEYCSRQSLSKILERDNIKNRMNDGVHIGVHEMLYPLFQGLDSLLTDTDVEIGGTDQTFNLLLGREVQQREGKEKQVAIMMPLLEGVGTETKMSKSLGNSIGIDDEPEVMFEKVMTIKDRQIISYFELLTDLSVDKINDFRIQLESNRTNPKNIKMRLAEEIVRLYHGEDKAIEARSNFIQVFSKGKQPKKIDAFKWEKDDTLLEFLVRHHIISSKSEVRRLVKQRGIKINDHVILEAEVVDLNHGDVIKIGKKRFVEISRC